MKFSRRSFLFQGLAALVVKAFGKKDEDDEFFDMLDEVVPKLEHGPEYVGIPLEEYAKAFNVPCPPIQSAWAHVLLTDSGWYYTKDLAADPVVWEECCGTLYGPFHLGEFDCES